jgi:hypothetical protein
MLWKVIIDSMFLENAMARDSEFDGAPDILTRLRLFWFMIMNLETKILSNE